MINDDENRQSITISTTGFDNLTEALRGSYTSYISENNMGKISRLVFLTLRSAIELFTGQKYNFYGLVGFQNFRHNFDFKNANHETQDFIYIFSDSQ